VEAVILILVLSAGDPASLTAAQAVAAALQQHDAKAQVVLPPDAAKHLAERGLHDADLVGHSEKVLLATAKDLRLVIVRVERRDTGSDCIVEVELWSGGRHDRMAAVSGKEGDPVPSAAEGARRLLRDAAHDPALAADRTDIAFIAGFAEQGDWKGLIAAVGARPDAGPRLRHAAILARLRMGDQAGAAAALAALQQSHAGHPLTTAAAVAVAADAGGADSLRDAAKPADDGGNTLR
jgi:hypothetical protein